VIYTLKTKEVFALQNLMSTKDHTELKEFETLTRNGLKEKRKPFQQTDGSYQS